MVSVSSIMQKHIVGVSVGTNVRLAITLMKKTHIAVMPVLDNGILVGLLAIDQLEKRHLTNEPVGVVMEPPEFVEESSSAESAASILVKTGHSRLPVVDNRHDLRVVGTITSTGIVHTLENGPNPISRRRGA
jgi:CBS domain-containing protein